MSIKVYDKARGHLLGDYGMSLIRTKVAVQKKKIKQ